MSKFKRLSLDDSEHHFPLLNEEARKALKGGCDGCSEWIVTYPGLPIYPEEEYLRLNAAGEWTGGLVCGFGYMLPEAVIYANMGYCDRHQEYYQDGSCYTCYLNDNHCDFHQVYFCYECNQPGGTMGGGETGGDGDCDSGTTGGGDTGSDGGGSTVIIPPGVNPGYDNGSSSIDFQSIVNENAGESFQESDKIVLKNALEQISENKVGKFILNFLTDRNMWLRFEIGDTVKNVDSQTGETWWAPAIYDPANDRIVFNSSEQIDNSTLSEELVHTVQKSIYGKEMVRANPNYEFEAKIIRDVITGTCSEQSYFPIEQDKWNYTSFIYDIIDGKLSESEVVERYRYFYTKWNDPDGIKQNIGPESPYYYDNGENNTFDTQILKMVLDARKNK